MVDAALRARNADLLQEIERASARFRRRQWQMGLDGLDELAADGRERIEAGQRILEDGADPGAAYFAHLLVGQVVDAPSFEADLARGDAARRLEQADDGVAGQRLAGPRFTDDAQDLAGRDVERHIVDGQQGAAPRRELDAQVLYFKKWWVVGGDSHYRVPVMTVMAWRRPLVMMLIATLDSARRAASLPKGSPPEP